MDIDHTPFARTTGPTNARIALVGEAFGVDEEKVKRPFIGQSGQELTRMLREAGLSRSDCFLTNVFALRPLGNNIETLCCSKGELPPGYGLSSIKQGKYIQPQYLPELARLKTELEQVKPNIVVALGNVACWALLGSAGISSLRGSISKSSLVPTLKVLPTYHPAGIMRNWSWRPIAIADLLKASREAEFPEIRRPRRELVVEPTLDEIHEWIEEHGLRASRLAVDIETVRGQIDMIGFASDPFHSLVIPFFSKYTFTDFWPEPGFEVQARQAAQRLLSSPIPKIFQNGLYDIQYLLRENFALRACEDDTMLLHHSLFPEMQKSLGFLGSIYCNETSWKLLNRKRGDEVGKKDD